LLADARDLEAGTVLRSDVCIVGAGPAGIALALGLADRGIDVILLESGGEAPEPRTQQLAAGHRTGAAQPPLESSRLRMLGGSTGHWAGICRPLAPSDFVPRSFVPHSGWPIPYETVAELYPEARRFLALGEGGGERGEWASLDEPGELLEAEGIVRLPVRARALRLGQHARPALVASDRIRVLLHANVTELIQAEGESRVARAKVAVLDGPRFDVEARRFVCATGGIENARLLLASQSRSKAGLGNEQGLVGRYFMDHPGVKPLGLMLVEADTIRRLSRHVQQGPVAGKSGVSLSRQHRRSERLLRHVLYTGEFGDIETMRGRIQRFESVFDVELDLLLPRDEQVIALLQALTPDQRLVTACYLECEQAPSPESRVTLTAERDALGVPRVEVDWRLGELEHETLRRASEIYAEILGRSGLGHLQVARWLREAEGDWSSNVVSGYHHMGTTRMASSPDRGVVDPDCRVFGIPNLFVAGSSVFPTVGCQAPTLTLVALSLRLARHLATDTGGAA